VGEFWLGSAFRAGRQLKGHGRVLTSLAVRLGMPILAVIASACIGCHLAAGYEGRSAEAGARDPDARVQRDASATSDT
jgi:hypothetical protein